MIDCESFKKGISKEIVGRFFSKLMLSYSFPMNRLYNVLHFVEFDMDPNYNKDDDLYDRKYQVERSYRRINNIAVRFTEDQKNSPKAIFKSKSYDSIMYEEMIMQYNHISKMFSRPAVRQVTDNLLKRAEVDTPFDICGFDDSWIEKGCCGSLSSIDRDALTLPEILLYTSLYMSTHARSLRTLNRVLVKNSDYTRAARWHESFMNEFRSQTLFKAIVYEIFDMLYEETVDYHIEASENSIQQFWLHERYRDRKDRKRAIKKLDKITENGVVSRQYLDAGLEKHPERIDEFSGLVKSVNIADLLLSDIIPRAELIALGELTKPTKKDWLIAEKTFKEVSVIYCDGSRKVSPEVHDKVCAEYEELQYMDVAAWLADIVIAVVNGGYASVERIIDCFPESTAWK